MLLSKGNRAGSSSVSLAPAHHGCPAHWHQQHFVIRISCGAPHMGKEEGENDGDT